jgi:hypothetical protein
MVFLHFQHNIFNVDINLPHYFLATCFNHIMTERTNTQFINNSLYYSCYHAPITSSFSVLNVIEMWLNTWYTVTVEWYCDYGMWQFTSVTVPAVELGCEPCPTVSHVQLWVMSNWQLSLKVNVPEIWSYSVICSLVVQVADFLEKRFFPNNSQ